MVPGAGGASECVRAEVFDEECGEGVRSGLQDRLVHVLYDLELPSALRVAYTTCACVTIFIVGWFIFVRKTANIAEEL